VDLYPSLNKQTKKQKRIITLKKYLMETGCYSVGVTVAIGSRHDLTRIFEGKN